MPLKVCVDTNLFISIVNKEADAIACKRIVNAIEQHACQASISTIVISEMLVGFYQDDKDPEADAFLAKIQKYYEILPVSIEIAQNAAQIRAKNRIKLPDAIVLASAQRSSADFLISRDHPLERKDKLVIRPQEFADKYLRPQNLPAQ